MPGLKAPGADLPLATGVSKSTYTRPLRVAASTVGARVRTLPFICAPPGAVTSTAVPGVMRPSSAEVTSPRHSRRPWRISRNISVPAPTTLPSVAVRAEMMPLSGAVRRVFFRRSAWASSCAWAEATRALAVCSCVKYWLTCCALRAPLPCTARARSALAAASAALAWASATAARARATSACTLSAAKVASTWPRVTRSPTLACNSATRRPLASAPTLASCQAATLPLAASLMVSWRLWGWVRRTVRAALAAGWATSAAWLPLANRPSEASVARASTLAAMMRRAMGWA